MGSLLSELIYEINGYLKGKSSHRDLETWVVVNLQKILDSGDATAIRIADEVDASFVEVGEGLIGQSTLKRRLAKLVRETLAAS